MSAPGILQVYRELTPLRHIKRFAQHACIAPISVAEHSYYVALLAAGFADELSFRGFALNRALVVETALWHDAPEAITGDIPASAKWEFPDIDKALDGAEEGIFQRFADLSGNPLAALRARGIGLERELAVVKLADWTELVLYVYEEVRSGNRGLLGPQDKVLHAIDGPLRKRFVETFGSEINDWYEAVFRQLGAMLGGERQPRMIVRDHHA